MDMRKKLFLQIPSCSSAHTTETLTGTGSFGQMGLTFSAANRLVGSGVKHTVISTSLSLSMVEVWLCYGFFLFSKGHGALIRVPGIINQLKYQHILNKI